MLLVMLQESRPHLSPKTKCRENSGRHSLRTQAGDRQQLCQPGLLEAYMGPEAGG